MNLSDRMKMYESADKKKLMPLVPALVRLDGKNFSTFTKGLKRPFDQRLTDVMIEVTKYLVEQTNALTGYTQSDEITLLFYSDTMSSQIFADGKVQKIESLLAAMASVKFNKLLPTMVPEKADKDPIFDARAWNVPTKAEAANVFLWREEDATRNSVQMACRSEFSHKESLNKNCKEMQAMLLTKGINWNDYPSCFKRGTYVQRSVVTRNFTEDELKNLPEKHEAHSNPDLEIIRHAIKSVEMPIFRQVTNKVSVLFNKEDPLKANYE